MGSLKSNFIKLGFVLTMVVVLLVALSLTLATSFDESRAGNHTISIGSNGGSITSLSQK